MALFDPYRRRYKEGQTVILPPPPQGAHLDGKVVEVSELASPSRNNPKMLVKRLTVVATFYFECPVESPGIFPAVIALQPEEGEAAAHAPEKKLKVVEH